MFSDWVRRYHVGSNKNISRSKHGGCGIRDQSLDQGVQGLYRSQFGKPQSSKRAHTRPDRPQRCRKNHLFQPADQVFLVPTSGSILFNGKDITAVKPAQIARKGIIRSFQISAVFPHLTVMENVRIGLQRPLGNSFSFWQSERSLNRLNDRAMELLAEVDLETFADTITVDLPYGRKRALEIATTLAMNPELMLLDEPTQGMGHEDVDRVTQLIKKVSAGRTILMVEHNMNVVSGISDRISVLQRGALLAEGTYAEVSSNPEVMEAYMGSNTGVLEGAHA